MKLNPKQHKDAIRAHLEGGASYRQIAEQFNVNKDTIANFVRKHLPEQRRVPQRRPSPEMPGMKILTIDIETSPNLAHVWGIWDQNIGLNQLLQSSEILCWAAKWLDEDLIRFKSSHAHGKEHMLQCAWNLLNEADAVMHYNGRSFDVPHLNREFVQAGWNPPAPFRQIDLLQVVRKQFKFPSYKLAYVSEALGVGSKIEHEGHELWIKCLNGDEDAWRRMREYNEQDVLLVEQLYDRLLAWITGHPSYGALTGEDVCPNCGGELEEDGVACTKMGQYQQYICTGCGKYSRSSKRIDGTRITEVVQ